MSEPLIGLLLLAALAPALGGTPPLEQVTAAMAIERAAECGLGPVWVREDRDLQADIVAVPQGASASDEQLACLDRAVGFGMFVELPSEVQARFGVIREARAFQWVKAEAEARLSIRGLLERVPIYVRGTSDDAAFLQSVEQLCGPHAKGAFRILDGAFVFDRAWLERSDMPPLSKGEEAMSCLFNVSTFNGFPVGFIGNEAARR